MSSFPKPKILILIGQKYIKTKTLGPLSLKFCQQNDSVSRDSARFLHVT